MKKVILVLTLAIMADFVFSETQALPTHVKGVVWDYGLSPVSGQWEFQPLRHLQEEEVREVFEQRLRNVDPKDFGPLAKHLVAEAKKNNVNPNLVLALIGVESTFNANATSSVGAQGLMQLMPVTAGYIAQKWKLKVDLEAPEALYDPYTNLTLGITYLGYLQRHFKQDFARFLSAYNAGPTLIARMDGIPSFTEPYVKGIRTQLAMLPR